MPDFANELAIERNFIERHCFFVEVLDFGKRKFCYRFMDLTAAATAITKGSAVITFMLMIRVFIGKFNSLIDLNHITFLRVAARHATLYDNVQGEYDAGPFQFCKYIRK